MWGSGESFDNDDLEIMKKHWGLGAEPLRKFLQLLELKSSDPLKKS